LDRDAFGHSLPEVSNPFSDAHDNVSQARGVPFKIAARIGGHDKEL
jgi:hypothetical protein